MRLPLILLAGVLAQAGCDDDEDDTLVEPLVATSEDGVLELTLEVKPTEFTLAGERVQGTTYDGNYIAPTLVVNQGDSLRLHIRNSLDEMTNLHTHGLNVSPLGNSDNVFVHINPGETFDYQIDLPESHPQGMFWYHSHAHGNAEVQVMGGLSGAILVQGLLDPWPELQGIRERVFVFKDAKIKGGEIDPDAEDATLVRTVNGMVDPKVDIRPGETQLWHVGNVGANAYYKLVLDGHTMYEVARDGNRNTELVPRNEILLPPSSRVEILVQAGAAGSYAFRHLDFNTGPVGDTYPALTLATMEVSGEAETPRTLPSQFPPVKDLRSQPIARERTIVFSENDAGDAFFINDKQFDMGRIDTTVQLGEVEEWILKNTSEEEHVFHIHQLDFQVTEINGSPNPFLGHQDTVNIPSSIDGTPGEVRVIIPFTDPIILGKFVYHCHILEHEDGGMMATIQVVE